MLCRTLANETRAKRRSIADALEVLVSKAGFRPTDRARVRIGQMEYMPGRVATLIGLVFEKGPRGETNVVWLPAAETVIGKHAASPDSETLRPLDLEDGIVDYDGRVTTNDGLELRAVSIRPAAMPIRPSPIQQKILGLTLHFIEKNQDCLRSLRDGLPEDLQEMVPDLRWIDYSKLGDLDRLPSLESITIYVRERDRALKKISSQTVADALHLFGMHVPKSRPRKRKQSAGPF